MLRTLAVATITIAAVLLSGVAADKLRAISNYPFRDLNYANYENLVAVCPLHVHIMQYNLSCEIDAFVEIGLTYANEVGPNNRSELGYAMLDEVIEFLNGTNAPDGRGAVSPLSDIWGYDDPLSGRTFALVCAGNGLSVVDVTVPLSPVETGFFQTYFSIWHDVKVRGSYAYVVHDKNWGNNFLNSLTNVKPEYLAPFNTGDGLLIVDITYPTAPRFVSKNRDLFQFAHNIYCETEEDRPYCYVCGGDVAANGGIVVLDMTDPINPTKVGEWDDVYIHDVVVQPRGPTYVLYGCGIYEGTTKPALFLIDVTNPSKPKEISSVKTPYPYTHNSWPTPDNNYLYVTHEDLGTPVTIWDISNEKKPKHVDDMFIIHNNQDISAHNAFVVDDKLWISYYTEGAAVYDITNPTEPVLLDSYDTSPQLTQNFGGAWGIWPFSTHGNVFVSDIENGLFSLTLVTDHPSGSNSSPSSIGEVMKMKWEDLKDVDKLFWVIGWFGVAHLIAFIAIIYLIVRDCGRDKDTRSFGPRGRGLYERT